MISLNLEIFLLVVTFVYFIIVLNAVKKDKMPIKSSALWFFIGILMLVLIIFPEMLVKIASLVGIKTISNLILFGAVLALLILSFDLYKINNTEKKKNITLAQEIGILKYEINKKQ